MIWDLLNTGFRNGSFNMEFDEKTARSVGRDPAHPILRFYGWKPHAISIGYNQSMNDFDIEKVSSSGIDIVRRPTGGRAILHSDELTYSVVMMLDDYGPRELYRYINEGLLHGLKLLGADAELTEQGADFKEFYKSPSAIPCFSSSAKCEIQYRGKKLVGSAQRRFGRAILQHGSILLGPDHRKIVDFLAPHLHQARNTLDGEMATRTIDLGEILGRRVSFDEAAEVLARGFSERHGIVFLQKELTEYPQHR